MTFSIRTFRADGSIAMDGSNKAGIFIEVVNLPYSTAAGGSRVYTQIPAGSMFVVIAEAGGQFIPVIGDDGAGHAKLTWAAASQGQTLNTTASTVFIVFAKKVNQTSTFGIKFFNNDGDQLIDITYPVPQYAGMAQPAAVSFRDWITPDGSYSGHEHKVTVNLRSTANRLVLVNLPDSTSTDAWYACRPFIQAGSSNSSFTLTLTIIKPRYTAYQVPSLHIFSLDGPISGGSSFGTRYYDPHGNLVYDSSAENITISDMQPVNYGTDSSISMNMPSQPGVVIPYYEYNTYISQPIDADGNDHLYTRNMAIVQRRGSTLYYKMYRAEQTPTQGGGFNIQSGVAQNNFTMLVDISHLTPSSIQGTPVTAIN